MKTFVVGPLVCFESQLFTSFLSALVAFPLGQCKSTSRSTACKQNVVNGVIFGVNGLLAPKCSGIC